MTVDWLYKIPYQIIYLMQQTLYLSHTGLYWKQKKEGDDDNEKKSVTSRPQKLRKPNCFNVFASECFKSEGAHTCSNYWCALLPCVIFLEFKTSNDALGTKNHIVGERWRQLSDDEKSEYKQIAHDMPHPDDLTPDSIWKETSKMLKKFGENVCV